ncbi:MAG: ABC transporter ATP-binding protein [Bdellovibrionales bacterium]|nr:ABC transporter ATP-binding protein [Bdellovibrionales bacterium]
MSNSKSSPLSRLLFYLSPYRSRVIRASAFSVLNKLFDIMPEVLIGMAIDVVVNKEASFLARMGVADYIHQLAILGALTFVIWVCESLFEYLYNLEWRRLAQIVQHKMRMETYEHAQNLDLAYYEDQSTGNLVAIINDDVNQLERFLDNGAVQLIHVMTSVVAVGAIFFYLSPLIASLAFAPIPVILWGAFYFQKRAQPLYAKVRNAAGQISARLTGNLSGIVTIKSFTAEPIEMRNLESDSQKFLEANEQAIRLSSAFIPLIRMAILTGFIFTLVIGGYLTMKGQLPVGSYGVLVFLTQRLLWPLTGLAQTVDNYERAMASSNRILDLLQTPIGIIDNKDSEMDGPIKGEIEFKEVSFKYSTGPMRLKGISFKMAQGLNYAFVGPTGSGKSTLMKLLLRFYEPTEGQIFIDGQPLHRYPLKRLRQAIGLVSQDVFLFQASLKANILYGRPDATDEEVLRAANLAEVDEFAQHLPMGYETPVGERGQKLSGGQKQRIALARAILKNAPILILDEATSAVDNETEAAIQRSLSKISKGRTILVIAHRLSTVVDADMILVIENGQIKEQGNHNLLVQNEGLYKNLWNVQTGL